MKTTRPQNLIAARTIGYAKRFDGAKVWPDKLWEFSLCRITAN